MYRITVTVVILITQRNQVPSLTTACIQPSCLHEQWKRTSVLFMFLDIQSQFSLASGGNRHVLDMNFLSMVHLCRCDKGCKIYPRKTCTASQSLSILSLWRKQIVLRPMMESMRGIIQIKRGVLHSSSEAGLINCMSGLYLQHAHHPQPATDLSVTARLSGFKRQSFNIQNENGLTSNTAYVLNLSCTSSFVCS